ncbi:MAG: hypothetical protein QOI35_2745 [Cryptosporangiaceae bacterium]|nr:hypothetical protein [Cryptosporangiaceae bacterium]
MLGGPVVADESVSLFDTMVAGDGSQDDHRDTALSFTPAGEVRFTMIPGKVYRAVFSLIAGSATLGDLTLAASSVTARIPFAILANES